MVSPAGLMASLYEVHSDASADYATPPFPVYSIEVDNDASVIVTVTDDAGIVYRVDPGMVRRRNVVPRTVYKIQALAPFRQPATDHATVIFHPTRGSFVSGAANATPEDTILNLVAGSAAQAVTLVRPTKEIAVGVGTPLGYAFLSVQATVSGFVYQLLTSVMVGGTSAFSAPFRIAQELPVGAVISASVTGVNLQVRIGY